MGKGRADDDDESAEWGLSGPEHAPPHERFFEDGDEPPARYDLPDAGDYIRANPSPISSARWYRLGAAPGWDNLSLYAHTPVVYYAMYLPGCCLGLVPYLVFVAPTLHADLTLTSLALLTGNSVESRFAYRLVPRFLTLAIANAPASISRLAALYGLYLIGAVIQNAWHVANYQRFHRHPSGDLDLLWLSPQLLLAGLLLIAGHTFIAVRVCGFTTHLILDHDLGPFQALRANWRVTRGRTHQLMRVKLWLWLGKYLTALVTFGLGLLLREPYNSAVWTAAYLDIAGSEPPYDPLGDESEVANDSAKGTARVSE